MGDRYSRATEPFPPGALARLTVASTPRLAAGSEARTPEHRPTCKVSREELLGLARHSVRASTNADDDRATRQMDPAQFQELLREAHVEPEPVAIPRLPEAPQQSWLTRQLVLAIALLVLAATAMILALV
jgi:hypothetical protein